MHVLKDMVKQLQNSQLYIIWKYVKEEHLTTELSSIIFSGVPFHAEYFTYIIFNVTSKCVISALFANIFQ